MVRIKHWAKGRGDSWICKKLGLGIYVDPVKGSSKWVVSIVPMTQKARRTILREHVNKYYPTKAKALVATRGFMKNYSGVIIG